MDHQARRLGLTQAELVFEDILNGLGWVQGIFVITAWIFRDFFALDRLSGGLAAGLTLAAGLVLMLASAGIRQNHAARDLGSGLVALAMLAWLAHGLLTSNPAAVLTGTLLAVMLGLMLYLNRRSIQDRFAPRFFSLRQFETVIQIADTMLDSDGEAVLHPISVAANIDHFLSQLDARTAEDLRSTLNIVEWGLPLITLGRPFPFSSLGSHARRRAIEKVVLPESPLLRSIYKDIARFLKLLACAGYYGSEEGMASVGYRPFEERGRGQGVDQAPLVHPDPFTQQGA